MPIVVLLVLSCKRLYFLKLFKQIIKEIYKRSSLPNLASLLLSVEYSTEHAWIGLGLVACNAYKGRKFMDLQYKYQAEAGSQCITQHCSLCQLIKLTFTKPQWDQTHYPRSVLLSSSYSAQKELPRGFLSPCFYGNGGHGGLVHLDHLPCLYYFGWLWKTTDYPQGQHRYISRVQALI